MNFYLKKIVNRLTNIRENKRYRHYLPNNHTVEDIFIVSFPKSGNTWFRFLIANAFKVYLDINRDVNFFSIQDIIPGIGFTKNINSKGLFGRDDLPRILTSHSPYNPYFGRVILLVRDPRDVMISYYYHSIKYDTISNKLSLSKFIRDKNFGARAWRDHVKSWILPYKKTGSQNIQIFKYEELLKDTHSQLYRVMNLLGFELKGDVLEKAVNLSSLDAMKKSEMNHMSPLIIKNQKTPFVRSGKRTLGKELSEEDRHYIENITKNILRLIGYNF